MQQRIIDICLLLIFLAPITLGVLLVADGMGWAIIQHGGSVSFGLLVIGGWSFFLGGLLGNPEEVLKQIKMLGK